MIHVHKKPRLKNSRYITGIDGLRALAVIGVIVYHLLPFDLKGGYMGVPIFFVISGYLITDLLMKEWHQTGRINLKSFYARRIKRLYPALVATVIGSGAYITIFQRSLLVHLRSVIWTNLLYVYNWWEIAHGQSYFDRFQGESPFIHLWTLSIDGQYYLFWPVVMIGLVLLFRKHRKILAGLFTLLTLLGAWYMSIIYASTSNINRVYYGTDTRMFSILAGVALAYACPADSFRRHAKVVTRIWLDVIGGVMLLGLIVSGFTMAGQSAFTYRGGMLMVTIESTVFLLTIVDPNADWNRLMTNPVFRWLGTRSYGIYLYQFPVMIFYESKVTDQALHPVVNALVEMVMIGLISEASYRWLEEPLRHYRYRNLFSDFRHRFLKNDSLAGLLKRLLMIPVAAVFLICGVGAVQAPNHQAKSQLQRRIANNQSLLKNGEHRLLQRQRHARKLPPLAIRQQLHRPLNKSQKSLANRYHLNKYQVLSAKSFPMTAVGDSVMVDSSQDLRQIFKNTYVKAKVGGQLSQAVNVLQQIKARHELQKNILINIGTNAPLTTGQINQVLRIAGPHRSVFWITTHVPTKPYQNSVNRNIKKMARRHRQLHVIDWYRLSQHHGDYFWSDHVHPNPKGNQAYVSLIARTIFK